MRVLLVSLVLVVAVCALGAFGSQLGEEAAAEKRLQRRREFLRQRRALYARLEEATEHIVYVTPEEAQAWAEEQDAAAASLLEVGALEKDDDDNDDDKRRKKVKKEKKKKDDDDDDEEEEEDDDDEEDTDGNPKKKVKKVKKKRSDAEADTDDGPKKKEKRKKVDKLETIPEMTDQQLFEVEHEDQPLYDKDGVRSSVVGLTGKQKSKLFGGKDSVDKLVAKNEAAHEFTLARLAYDALDDMEKERVLMHDLVTKNPQVQHGVQQGMLRVIVRDFSEALLEMACGHAGHKCDEAEASEFHMNAINDRMIIEKIDTKGLCPENPSYKTLDLTGIEDGEMPLDDDDNNPDASRSNKGKKKKEKSKKKKDKTAADDDEEEGDCLSLWESECKKAGRRVSRSPVIGELICDTISEFAGSIFHLEKTWDLVRKTDPTYWGWLTKKATNIKKKKEALHEDLEALDDALLTEHTKITEAVANVMRLARKDRLDQHDATKKQSGKSSKSLRKTNRVVLSDAEAEAADSRQNMLCRRMAAGYEYFIAHENAVMKRTESIAKAVDAAVQLVIGAGLMVATGLSMGGAALASAAVALTCRTAGFLQVAESQLGAKIAASVNKKHALRVTTLALLNNKVSKDVWAPDVDCLTRAEESLELTLTLFKRADSVTVDEETAELVRRFEDPDEQKNWFLKLAETVNPYLLPARLNMVAANDLEKAINPPPKTT